MRPCTYLLNYLLTRNNQCFWLLACEGYDPYFLIFQRMIILSSVPLPLVSSIGLINVLTMVLNKFIFLNA